MSLSANHIYEFGPYRLEPAERRLLREGEAVPLPPKAFDVLVVLASRAGRLVSKDELMRAVWPDTFVEEANLSYTVSLLRKALATSPDERPIDTVQKLGYRFTVPVNVLSPEHALVRAATAAAEEPVAPRDAAPGRRRWPGRWPAAAAALLLTTALGVAASTLTPLSSARAAVGGRGPLRFDVDVPRQLTMSWDDHPAISPDGRRIVFAAVGDGKRRLWMRALDSTRVTALEGTEGGVAPFWSPDSRRVGFFVHGVLKTIAADGGVVRTLAPATGASGAWTSSGHILFGAGRIHRVPESGGSAEPITRGDAAGKTRQEVIGLLADGLRFVYRDEKWPGRYWIASSTNPEDVRQVDLGTEAHRVVVAGRHLVYESGGTLVAQPLDARTGQPTGDVVPLAAADLSFLRPSASGNGVVVFRSGREAPRHLTWRGRTGTRLETIGGPDAYWQVELSPSGTRAVVVRGGERMDENDLWLLDVPRSALSRLTAHRGREADPAWSPDERRIAYSSAQAGAIAPFVKDLGTGAEARLWTTPGALVVDDWTRDGRILARNFGRGVFALTVGEKGAPERLVDTPFVEDQVQASPAGTWVAFNSDESDGWEVYVARLPGFTEKRLVSRGGGVQPRWRADGRELYYLAPDGTLMAVAVEAGTSLTLGIPRPLFETALREPNPEIPQYDVSADGQRFLLLEPTEPSHAKFTFLVDWLP